MAEASSNKGSPGDDKKKDSSDSEDDDPSFLDKITRLLSRKLSLSDRDDEEVEKRLKEPTVQGIVDYMKSGSCKSIVALVGAGMSTSAGIPDFRSPGSGIYDNLQQYNLPSPEAMFEIGYFKHNPKPFYHLAKTLMPQDLKPTPSHYFLKVLHDRGLLTRVFTQNIDNLERLAGLPDDAIVEAHGSFHSAHCLKCRKKFDYEWVKGKILSASPTEEGKKEEIVIPKCDSCDGLIKPDIVFFGESLPSRFFHLAGSDLPKCDMIIVIGTSLTVQPFASLVDSVPPHVPRLAINLTKFKEPSRVELLLGLASGGWKFDSPGNYRDVFMQGYCDDKIKEFADSLGWKEDLEKLTGEKKEETKKEE